MHESPLVRGLIATAIQAVKEGGAASAIGVTIVIGELTGIDEGSVRTHFEVMSEGTPVAGAVVTVVKAPATAACWDCAHSFEATSADQRACPACGSAKVRVAPGPQPYVSAVDTPEKGE